MRRLFYVSQHKQEIQGRWIEVFACTSGDVYQAKCDQVTLGLPSRRWPVHGVMCSDRLLPLRAGAVAAVLLVVEDLDVDALAAADMAVADMGPILTHR